MTEQEVVQLLSESNLNPEIRFDEDSGFMYFGVGFSLKGDAKQNLMKSLSDASSLLNSYIDKLNGQSQYSVYICGYHQGYKDKSSGKRNEF